ncbi:MAG: c-type cytochrome [Nitrospinales bacterium]
MPSEKCHSKDLIFLLSAVLLLVTATDLSANEGMPAEEIIPYCAPCHRFEGKPKSKFTLEAPDLIWAGSKYQRKWLLGWLQGKEENIYPKGYRWDKSQIPIQHATMPKKEAIAVADYFEKNLKDPRVKKNAIDLSEFTEREAGFGAEIFKEFSCIACHQIKEDKHKTGGPISTNLYDAGNRYNPDWLYRFALNPQDFTPHSGEYLADLSALGVRYLVGYLMTLGVADYKFFEPWKTTYYKNADPKRGAGVYKNYCAQCHGFKGEGDGPGASGLNPKPAVHAQMALNKMQEEYLYNVVFYGGKSVGKSALMPDWGLTLPPQDLADVIAYLKATFTGGKTSAEATAPLTQCPQPRKTQKAPADIHDKSNPLEPSAANIKAGRILYQRKAKPRACKQCHGMDGDGGGPMATQSMSPKPRNFTCSPMMKNLTDGQLFWIIKNGSAGTQMPAYKKLKDQQVWQLIHYLRQFAK